MAQTDKERLIQQLNNARSELTHAGQQMGKGVDVSHQVRGTLTKHQPIWLAISGFIGLLVARLTTRRKAPTAKVELNRSSNLKTKDAGKGVVFLAIGKIILDVIKPPLVTWLRNQIVPRPSISARK